VAVVADEDVVMDSAGADEVVRGVLPLWPASDLTKILPLDDKE
jgi:hypothetical protein